MQLPLGCFDDSHLLVRACIAIPRANLGALRGQHEWQQVPVVLNSLLRSLISIQKIQVLNLKDPRKQKLNCINLPLNNFDFNFNPFSYFHVAQKGARRLGEASYDRVLDSRRTAEAGCQRLINCEVMLTASIVRRARHILI